MFVRKPDWAKSDLRTPKVARLRHPVNPKLRIREHSLQLLPETIEEKNSEQLEMPRYLDANTGVNSKIQKKTPKMILEKI